MEARITPDSANRLPRGFPSPGGRLPDGTNRLVTEEPCQARFVAIWEEIARRSKDHPGLWAYDLVNEPVQHRPSPPGVKNWLEIQVAAAKAIRAIDAKTPIILETEEWDSASPFRLIGPVDVPNVIYQVHMYHPIEFTHQGVFTDQGLAKDKNEIATIAYPGTITRQWTDKETLRAWLQPVRDFQQAYDARIYVGEFSAIRWARRNTWTTASPYSRNTAGTGPTTPSANGRDGAWRSPTSRAIALMGNPRRSPRIATKCYKNGFGKTARADLRGSGYPCNR